MLSPAQVAKYLAISVAQVRRLPLARVKFGTRTIRYRSADVEAYIHACRSND